jgi:signal transduction histidine kinase
LGAINLRYALRTQLSLSIMLIVLLAVAGISVSANVLVARQFEHYILRQEQNKAAAIAESLASQYDPLSETWNADYLHGVGMYALYDGYIIRVFDRWGRSVWDAENHDMYLCAQITSEITTRMAEHRPEVAGQFVSQEFALTANGQSIGSVAISYYGPYFMSDADLQFLDALNAALLTIGALSLIVAFVVGVLLARRISRPITRTAYIAQQISAGNYAIRFAESSTIRELNDLMRAVNDLARGLSEQENLRKRLTANVAHELRTPISAISSHLEAMIDGYWQPTPERLKSCHEEILRLGTLVADLERLTQSENEDVTLAKEPLDLLEIVRAVCETAEAQARQKDIRLSVSGESSIIPADGDRIRQVVGNLLSNALKYTPEHGAIQAEVYDYPACGEISVEDSGNGIAGQDLPLIFERFYRAEKSRNRKSGGAGIGLAIVKSIVTAHGGTVEVESRLEQGSRFVVRLPKG